MLMHKFVLIMSSVCLRVQINPQNKAEFSGIGPERAFADFIFAHVILHLVVINFIGWWHWSDCKSFLVNPSCSV